MYKMTVKQDMADRRKRVLIVIPSLEQGGGQKFVVDLAAGLDEEKFCVKLLVFYPNTGSIFDKEVARLNIDTVYLDKSKGFSGAFARKVKSEIVKFSPDVIHTNLHSMLYLFPSYKRNQIKIHTVHTLAEKESCGLQRLVRFVAYKIMGVVPVAICDTVAESISSVHGLKKKKIPIVYNGVDCARYDLPKIESTDIRLVTVGSIYEVKNYLFLVECFAKLLQSVPNLRLRIVGDGVQRTELEEKITTLGISNKVEITGVVSNVETYLADADLYVATSLFEGLPLSMLEAMSAGLPIVSTAVGGVPDVVKDGANGLLVKSGDGDAFVDACKQIVENEKMRKEFSVNAKTISRSYDVAKMIEGYANLYLHG